MAAALLLALLLGSPSGLPAQPESRRIAHRVFSSAFEHKMIEKPMGEVITFVGRQLIGSPYEANTLDPPGRPGEELVCNLATFDCVTFVENVLALSRCIKGNRLAYEAYEHELLTIRYRGGVMSGYGSRLHYFSDWIGDNVRKGIVREITRDIGVPYRKPVVFMSTHRSLYPKLAADSTVDEIRNREDSLNAAEHFYLPKGDLARLERDGIANGDLIAITTSAAGLDVGHTGIAIRLADGSLHLLHAPDVGRNVEISGETLSRYLRKHRTQTGVMVVRALAE